MNINDFMMGPDPTDSDINEVQWMFRKIGDMEKGELKEVIHQLLIKNYNMEKDIQHERKTLRELKEVKPGLFGTLFR